MTKPVARKENILIRICKAYPVYDRPRRSAHAEDAPKKAMVFFRKIAGTRSA
jgi:hypothetical protein